MNFGVGHDPEEVVGPHKAAYLMWPLPFQVQTDAHSFPCPILLDALLAQTSIESERAFDTFEHQVLTFHVRGPRSAIRVCHNFRNMPRPRLVTSCLDVLSSKCVVLLSFIYPVYLTSPVRGNFIPDASSIVPPPSMPPLYGSSFIPFACAVCHHLVLLYLKTLFRMLITALGLHIADPSHGSPHTFGDHLIQRG